MFIRTIAIVFVLLFSSRSALAEITTVTLSVPGMSCATCPIVVKGALSKLDGVQSVTTSLEEKTATVIYDDEVTDVDAMKLATKNAGFPSTPI